MPENTELAIKLFPVIQGFHQVIDADVLMVFGDNLRELLAVVKHDKVLNVINKSIFSEQTFYKVIDRGSILIDLLPVWLFFFAVDLQPFEEEIVSAIKGAYSSF